MTSSPISFFKQLVPIANPSGREAAIRNAIETVAESCAWRDRHIDTAGNLLVRIPGNPQKPAVLLSAHMDSVPPCEGIVAVEDMLDGRSVLRSAGQTILGADDKAGIAVMLDLMTRLTAVEPETHPTVEMVFSTQEEVGLLGAKAFDLAQCRAQYGMVLDGEGQLGEIFVAGPSQINLQWELAGVRSHAGIAPDQGTNAIAMATQLCARLPNGRLDEMTTANMGWITGGDALNVVAPHAVLKGEIRSHDEDRLTQLLEEIQALCKVTETAFPGGTITFTPTRRYTRYEVPADHPVIQRAEYACRIIGRTPQRKRMNIGSDAHVFNHAGLPTVVLGMGFHYSHSLGEYVFVDELTQVSQWVWEILNQPAH